MQTESTETSELQHGDDASLELLLSRSEPQE